MVSSNGRILWDSGKVLSDNSVAVDYKGEPLQSNTEYIVSVTVWDIDGNMYSSESKFETALLNQNDWKGIWIGMGDKYRSDWAIQLRKDVKLKGKNINKAKAYVVGLGYYELRLNGEKVGDHMLDTAQSEYEETVYYATYDITNMLKAKENCFWLYSG